ncbi:MAG: hypothetical protein R2788_18285 [Saprospiraceae bacterium]
MGLNLTIQDNGSLANLDGLSSLTSVGDLYIYSNGMLANLDGLSAHFRGGTCVFSPMARWRT